MGMLRSREEAGERWKEKKSKLALAKLHLSHGAGGSLCVPAAQAVDGTGGGVALPPTLAGSGVNNRRAGEAFA